MYSLRSRLAGRHGLSLSVALDSYGADGTGIPDYAMGPAGAEVLGSMTSDTFAADVSHHREKQACLTRSRDVREASADSTESCVEMVAHVENTRR